MIEIGRRAAIGGGLVAALLGASGAVAAVAPVGPIYGSVGRMLAKSGQRAALVAILREATVAMPGCIAYLVNEDAANVDGIWITEVWDSKASHDASLALPAVRAAITRGRPLIAGFDLSLEVAPKG